MLKIFILLAACSMVVRAPAQGRVIIATNNVNYKNEIVNDILNLSLRSKTGRSIIYEVFCGHNQSLVIADPVLNKRLEENTVYPGSKQNYEILSLALHESKRSGINESLLVHEMTHFVNSDSMSNGMLIDDNGYLIVGVLSDEIRAVQVQNQVLYDFWFSGRKYYGEIYVFERKLLKSDKYKGQNVYELEHGESRYIPVLDLPILTLNDFSIRPISGMERESFKILASNTFVLGEIQYVIELYPSVLPHLV